MKNKKPGLFFVLFGAGLLLSGQNLIDGVAALVGEHVILKSDVAQLVQMTAIEQRLDPRLDMDKLEKLQKQVLQSLINQKLILEIAEVESIEVEDREVDQAVEQYLAQSISQAGSEEQLEKILGKRVGEIRRMWWPDMRDQLIAERYQGRLFGGITITRDEVFVFYNNYKDSLGSVPTLYNTDHIFFKLRPGRESRRLAYSFIDSLKKRVLLGDSFSQLAEMFSQDPGSARNGGEMGFVTRGTFVPAFEQAAYALEPGKVSDIIETEFGYHIIEVLEAMGDKVNVRHILIAPKVSPADEDSLYAFALNIRDSTTMEDDFSRLAKKYSDDISTKDLGGRLGWVNPNQFPIEEIGQVLPTLKVGFPSPPVTTKDGFHLLLLLEVKEGGTPTLATHWSEIEGLALARKKSSHFNGWLKEASASIYVENFLIER